MPPTLAGVNLNFYPRSPCGERPSDISSRNCNREFLSTLSLRRATGYKKISPILKVFLSTLSLRRATQKRMYQFSPKTISIHALLAESDSAFDVLAVSALLISIHALLAESDLRHSADCSCHSISIHALLAESDIRQGTASRINGNFYPRSPCGERHSANYNCQNARPISIHALLAESDSRYRHQGQQNPISIHALLAESDVLRKVPILSIK